jgi:hypothetical protein
MVEQVSLGGVGVIHTQGLSVRPTAEQLIDATPETAPGTNAEAIEEFLH